MKKRILGILLTLTMVMSLMTFTATAAETYSQDIALTLSSAIVVGDTPESVAAKTKGYDADKMTLNVVITDLTTYAQIESISSVDTEYGITFVLAMKDTTSQFDSNIEHVSYGYFDSFYKGTYKHNVTVAGLTPDNVMTGEYVNGVVSTGQSENLTCNSMAIVKTCKPSELLSNGDITLTLSSAIVHGDTPETIAAKIKGYDADKMTLTVTLVNTEVGIEDAITDQDHEYTLFLHLIMKDSSEEFDSTKNRFELLNGNGGTFNHSVTVAGKTPDLVITGEYDQSDAMYSLKRWAWANDVTCNCMCIAITCLPSELTVSGSSSGGSGSGATTTTYNVNCGWANNGYIYVDNENCAEGETVTVYVEPNDGYILNVLYYYGDDDDDVYATIAKNSNDKYTFTMPASDLTIEATFITKPTFKAATADSGYYADKADGATKEGIIAFTSQFKDFGIYNTNKITKFGMLVYNSEDNKIDISSNSINQLTSASANGAFYYFVTDIASENFNVNMYALPYIVYDGVTYFGNILYSNVNATKWLGDKATYSPVQ